MHRCNGRGHATDVCPSLNEEAELEVSIEDDDDGTVEVSAFKAKEAGECSDVSGRMGERESAWQVVDKARLCDSGAFTHMTPAADCKTYFREYIIKITHHRWHNPHHRRVWLYQLCLSARKPLALPSLPWKLPRLPRKLPSLPWNFMEVVEASMEAWKLPWKQWNPSWKLPRFHAVEASVKVISTDVFRGSFHGSNFHASFHESFHGSNFHGSNHERFHGRFHENNFRGSFHEIFHESFHGSLHESFHGSFHGSNFHGSFHERFHKNYFHGNFHESFHESFRGSNLLSRKLPWK